MRRSLRARLVAYFLLLSTVTVGLVGTIVYVRATGDLTASVYSRLDAVAALKADALTRWIDEQSRAVVFVGVMPGVGDDTRVFLDLGTDSVTRAAAEARIRSVLATVVAQMADAEEILVLDLNGVIRISTLPEHEGKSVADQDFFITGQSHTTVQNPYTSQLTGRPTITVASPLFDANGGGQRVAVVAADLSMQRVDRFIVDRTGLGGTGRAYLVGLDGRLVQGTTASGASQLVSSFAASQLMARQSGEALYLDGAGTPVIGVYRWLANRNAGLVTEMTQDEAFNAARALFLTIGLVGLGSATLLAAGIWIVARRVTRPILSLAATAARVQAGDLEATSGIRAEDEVGALAAAFDEMTAELRENVATLERRVDERTTEIRRQKQYFEALVEVSPVAIVTMDRDERVSGWNPAATAMFGYEADAAIGHRIQDLVVRSEQQRDQSRDLVAEALEHGRAHQIGQRMRRDGSLLDVEIVIVPLVVDEEHLGFYAIYHDITELQAARRDADAANQAKSAFLAAMSHEIRTPMNAVIGMSGLLLDTPLDEEQRDYAETVNTSGEALLTIINDILDFSKIEAGRFELDLHPMDIAATLEGALDVMGAVATKKGIELAYAPDPALPPVAIGDSGRIRQIVLNLLSNALKFTDRGEVVCEVRGTPLDGATAETGRWLLEIDVVDSGIGIAPDRIGRLFQSFTQADSSIARKYGGTGLGLAISRRLAELMDGTITAESSGVPGEGSTFRLTAYVSASPRAVGLGAEDNVADAVDLHGKRALIIDDNATNLRILAAQLGRLGMSVITTSSAIEGRDLALEADSYDIVIADMRMPELDGLGIADALVSSSGDAPPVVILSSLGQRDREAPGVAAFLTKPVKPRALRDTIAAVLSGGVVRSAGTATRGFAADPEMATRHPLRLLLAEDNPFNVKLAVRLLERMGYTTDLAENGVAALDAVARSEYDVILMDVQMPEMDGLEATREVRRRWPDRPISIIALTANAMEGDRERCFAAGMNDYLVKPIRPGELTAALLAVPAFAGVEPPAPDATPAPAPAPAIAGSMQPEPADGALPALDPAALDRLLAFGGGDAGFVAELVDTFIEDAAGQLARLDAAVEARSMADIILASHSLKSNSANAGAMRLAAICRSIESDARAGAVPDAESRAAQARGAFSEAREALLAGRNSA